MRLAGGGHRASRTWHFVSFSHERTASHATRAGGRPLRVPGAAVVPKIDRSVLPADAMDSVCPYHTAMQRGTWGRVNGACQHPHCADRIFDRHPGMNRHRRSGSVEDVRTEQKRQRRRPALCRVRVVNGRSLRGCPFILLSDTAPTGTIERSAARASDCISAVAATQLAVSIFATCSELGSALNSGTAPVWDRPALESLKSRAEQPFSRLVSETHAALA